MTIFTNGRLARLQDFDFSQPTTPILQHSHRSPTEHAVIGSLDLHSLSPVLRRIVHIWNNYSWINQSQTSFSEILKRTHMLTRMKTTPRSMFFKTVCFTTKTRKPDVGCSHWKKLCAPISIRGTLLNYCHDHPTAGHLGVSKTLARLRFRFFWPKMAAGIKQYVTSCSVCQLNKPCQRKPAVCKVGNDSLAKWQICRYLRRGNMGGHTFYRGLQNFQVHCLFINRIKKLMVLMSKIYIGENMIGYKMTGFKALFLFFFI